MNSNNRRVYISYAWGGESERVADLLDADLQASGVAVVRDKRDLGYKGRIGDFMREIGRGEAVIVIISDKYLRSDNCMYELVEVARNESLYERVFPVVLADADIYKPVNRLRYVAHWEDELRQLNDAMIKVNQANLHGLRDEIDKYDTIRDHVARLTFFLKDMNTLTPDMHEGSNFAGLIASLRERLDKASQSASPAASGLAPAATSAAAPASKPTAAAPVAAPVSPAPAMAAGGTDGYAASVGERLVADGYTAQRGERFGALRFKAANAKTLKSFLCDEHYHAVVLSEPPPSAERLAAVESQLQAYALDLNARDQSNHSAIGLVLAPSLDDAAKRWLHALKPPKLGWGDGSLATLVVYDAAAGDIEFPQELPKVLECKFIETIKAHLSP